MSARVAQPSVVSVTRRLVPLTGEELERLPGPCRTCLFWEMGASPTAIARGAKPSHPEGGSRGADPAVRKQAWATAQLHEGHPAGRAVLLDDEVVGYALFAPAPAFAARTGVLPAPSDDALFLATMWVSAVHREGGLGRLLVQAAIKEALRLGCQGVEAYGDRRWIERGCLLPATWLLHEGFEVHREHPRTPLLRVDVRRTLRWSESLEHAVEEVLGRLPRRVPAPVAEVLTREPRRGAAR